LRKAEGKSEEQAVSIALERFGDEKQLTRGLFHLFKAQSKIVKNLFRISLISFVVGLVFLISLM
jgi:hypothetical protein